MKKKDKKMDEKDLCFYNAIISARIEQGFNITNILISISMACIAVLPELYKNTNGYYLSFSLLGFGLVVVLGLLMNHLDCLELRELQKCCEHNPSSSYSAWTKQLLLIMHLVFILALGSMLFAATQIISQNKENTMSETKKENQNIQSAMDHLYDLKPSTQEKLPKPNRNNKKESTKKNK